MLFNNLKFRILSGWSFVRLLYVGIGFLILFSSLQKTEWLGILLGAYFSGMGILNVGCASGKCSVPMNKLTKE